MAAVAVAAGEYLGEGKTSSYKQTNVKLGITMATSQDDLPKQDPVNNLHINQLAAALVAKSTTESLEGKRKQTASAIFEISGQEATATNSDKSSKRSRGTQRTKSQRSHKKSKPGHKKQTETLCPSEIATDDQTSH
eukprot:6639704-Ditylum_brightwellii.AAC.1